MDLNFWLTVNLARSTLISQYLQFTQYNLVQVFSPTFTLFLLHLNNIVVEFNLFSWIVVV